MSSAPSIYIGSIIHLENQFENGGYLETRGRITEKGVITKWHDPHIQAFVSTHEGPDRSNGSGSWKVLSATGKASGQALEAGDQIHLLNMYQTVGYLDSFEWVRRLEPFSTYPMTLGVFTADVPKRGGGLSGTWIVRKVKEDGVNKIAENDLIYLENAYPGAGFLYTYGRVATHDLFTDYDGQEKFVFTNPITQVPGGSPEWKIILNRTHEVTHKEEVTQFTYFVRFEHGGEWLDAGIFEFDGQPPHTLDISSSDNGVTVQGQLNEKDQVVAHWSADTQSYHLENSPARKWLFGRKITRLVFKPNADDSRRMEGTITYWDKESQEEQQSRFNAVRALALNWMQFFESAQWKSRIKKMNQALAAAIQELDEALFAIPGFSLDKLAALIDQAGGESYLYLAKAYILQGHKDTADDDITPTYWQLLQGNNSSNKSNVKALFDQARQELQSDLNSSKDEFDHLNAKLLQWTTERNLPQPTAPTASIEANLEYQAKQLMNIYTLWDDMNGFWRLLSDKSIQTIDDLSAAQLLPPVHYIRECFKQFTIDFEIVQSAIQQRRSADLIPDQETVVDSLAASLSLTDKLSAKALSPFQHLLTNESDVIPVTYFSKHIHIRRTPYGDRFILVGITYDLAIDSTQADSLPFELMAIPHEVGHFIYHYGKLHYYDERSFLQLSEDKFSDHPYYHWCEEIFADLYGCIVAGPLTAIGLLALLATRGKDEVLKGDELHPTAMIRPYFLSEMLRMWSTKAADDKPENMFNRKEEAHRSYDFSNVADDLDKNWTSLLERWGFTAEGVTSTRPSKIKLPRQTDWHVDRYVNIEDALDNIREIIAEFITQLDREYRKRKGESLKPWCQDKGNLIDFINELKELPQTQKSATSHVGLAKRRPYTAGPQHLGTLSKAELPQSDNESFFVDLLARWIDSGPYGIGGH